MTHCVKDLSVEQKSAVESLLGRPVSDDESIMVKAFAPSPSVNPEERRAAIESLKHYFAHVDANRQPASDEEEEEVITEAIRSVRPNYRPVG
jgi:hypothetical protein